MLFTLLQTVHKYFFFRRYTPLRIFIDQRLAFVFESAEDTDVIKVYEYQQEQRLLEYSITKDIFKLMLSYILYEYVGQHSIDVYFQGTTLEYHIDREATLEDSQEYIVHDTIDFITRYWGKVMH